MTATDQYHNGQARVSLRKSSSEVAPEQSDSAIAQGWREDGSCMVVRLNAEKGAQGNEAVPCRGALGQNRCVATRSRGGSRCRA